MLTGVTVSWTTVSVISKAECCFWKIKLMKHSGSFVTSLQMKNLDLYRSSLYQKACSMEPIERLNQKENVTMFAGLTQEVGNGN